MEPQKSLGFPLLTFSFEIRLKFRRHRLTSRSALQPCAGVVWFYALRSAQAIHKSTEMSLRLQLSSHSSRPSRICLILTVPTPEGSVWHLTTGTSNWILFPGGFCLQRCETEDADDMDASGPTTPILATEHPQDQWISNFVQHIKLFTIIL